MMQGKDVINFGLTSTPMSYFAVCHLKADGCAMITASHNPKEYNGVKFTRENALPISEDTGIKIIEKKVMENDFKTAKDMGKIIRKDVKGAYKKHLCSFIDQIKGLHLVVDASSGMASMEINLIEDVLQCKVTKLCFDIDGNFPYHDANPMKERSADMLKKTVKADVGIIFDGDADRVFFADETGEIIPSDYITALISEEVLSHHPKSTILYDLRSSWIVPEMIEKFGGRPLMCRVGHSFIKETMRKTNAPFAGELSGHFYFKDNFYTDSGIITAIMVLNLLSRKKVKIASLTAPLKKYFASGEINSEVKDKEAKMRELEKRYASGKISHLDGIKIEFSDWWFNVRPSNTEPLLRLNLEAKTQKMMQEKRGEILELMRA